MSAITRIRAWSNPGFTEDGPEAPHYGYTLPSPSEDLRNLDYEPSASRIFSEFKIANAVWESWRGMSFLEVTYSWNNSLSNTVLYGFIDEVELLSDTTGAAAVRVRWHVDEWMTYLGTATLGFGHVLRRPVGAADPIQSYGRKFWHVNSKSEIVPLSDLFTTDSTWWLLIAAGITDGGGNTELRYYAVPFDTTNTIVFADDGGGSPVPFIPYRSLLYGCWDEDLGLDPAQIYGAWIVPVAPMGENYWSGYGTLSDPIVTAGTDSWVIAKHNSYAHFETRILNSEYSLLFPETSVSYVATATELNPIAITGFEGESLGELPIGFSVTAAKYHVAVSATECYIVLRFDGTDSRIEGLCFTVPALPVDLTENAWSSYQYSGQRDYDVTHREQESIRSGVESIVSGGGSGALIGGIGPMGAAAGVVAGAISGAVSLGTDLLWYNEAEQNAKDKLAARQSPGILLPGGAWDAVTYGRTIMAVVLEMDSYSAGRASDERSLVGVKVDEYNSSNDTVRSSTGYYQIANLAVTGAIPNSAKRTIANRFAKGVRLI